MGNPDITKKILIMAGGTGGHVFPALSIAQNLLAKGITVEWMGTRNGLEASVIPDACIPIHFISISGLRGKSIWKKLLAPFLILYAVLQSMIKLLSVRPNCVLGMGGFVTGPGGIAAWVLGKRLLIHEQNAIAGFTNQVLFPFATTVMEAFPGSFERKKQMTSNPFLRPFIKSERVIVVGNPVRASMLQSQAPEDRISEQSDRLKILVLGGSSGAVAINRLIPETLASLPAARRPEILHQCGRRNLQETRELYRRQEIEPGDDVTLVEFIDDMAQAYCWADLVICRAGAITISEIANIGLGSVLIPFPYAVDDHQTENARVLLDAGAAFVIQEEDFSVERLGKILDDLGRNRKELIRLARAARSVAQPRAGEIATTVCMEACHG